MNQIKEQPKNQLSQSLDKSNLIDEGNYNLGSEGSLLGKFKDVNSLAKAYTSLQSEFTKKSQKLSELEKQDNLEGKTKINEMTKGDIELQNNNKILQSNDSLLSETSTNDTMHSTHTNKNEIMDNDLPNKPVYLSENWSDEVAVFLDNNKNAKKFSKEIAQAILSDKDVAKLPNSLEVAYAKVLAKNFKSEDELINDENFINSYILSNDKIKQKIIQNYLNSIQHNVPKVISGSKGGAVGLIPHNKPINLNEAGKIMERMLKQK